MDQKNYSVEDFYFLKILPMYRSFKLQPFSFWMLCGYLIIEFVRPQSLYPAIDILPWAQFFLVCSMCGLFFDTSRTLPSSSASVCIILFALMILASTLLAEYPQYSQEYLMFFFGWFITYFLIITIVNTKEKFYMVLIIYVLAAGKIAVGTSKNWAMRGFSFQSWGLVGPPGYFQNSGELAILMLMIFPMAYFLFINLKDRIVFWEKVVLLMFWVCPIFTILGASSRGAQIALCAQLLLIFRKSLFKPKALIGFIIIIMGIFFLLPEEQKERFTDVGEDKTSQQRLLYWENGWEMMKDHPLVGVGFFNFIPYYEDHYRGDMLYSSAQLPHNIFIQVGTDAGFIALFLFVLLLLISLHLSISLAKRKDFNSLEKAISAGLGYGILGYIIAGQFVTVTYYPFFWVHLAFLVAYKNVMERKRL